MKTVLCSSVPVLFIRVVADGESVSSVYHKSALLVTELSLVICVGPDTCPLTVSESVATVVYVCVGDTKENFLVFEQSCLGILKEPLVWIEVLDDVQSPCDYLVCHRKVSGPLRSAV